MFIVQEFHFVFIWNLEMQKFSYTFGSHSNVTTTTTPTIIIKKCFECLNFDGLFFLLLFCFFFNLILTKAFVFVPLSATTIFCCAEHQREKNSYANHLKKKKKLSNNCYWTPQQKRRWKWKTSKFTWFTYVRTLHATCPPKIKKNVEHYIWLKFLSLSSNFFCLTKKKIAFVLGEW